MHCSSSDKTAVTEVRMGGISSGLLEIGKKQYDLGTAPESECYDNKVRHRLDFRRFRTEVQKSFWKILKL